MASGSRGLINPMLQQHLDRVAVMQKQRAAQNKLRLKHQHDIQNAAAKLRQQMEMQALEHQHERLENGMPARDRMQGQPGTPQNAMAGQPRMEVPNQTSGMPPGPPTAGPF